ncbi:hypothetical protein Lal_00005963 [Lupinus albus]|nr:hypothetical protein Lal_00005963 [Lupinus albus]
MVPWNIENVQVHTKIIICLWSIGEEFFQTRNRGALIQSDVEDRTMFGPRQDNPELMLYYWAMLFCPTLFYCGLCNNVNFKPLKGTSRVLQSIVQ